MQGNIFELAKDYCRQKHRANKMNVTNSVDPIVGLSVNSLNTVPLVSILDILFLFCNKTNLKIIFICFYQIANVDPAGTGCTLLPLPHRKSQKVSLSGKSRGRPSGMNNKLFQTSTRDSSLTQNQCNSKYPNSNITGSSNSTPSNPYCLNSFLNPSILSAVLTPGFNTDMIDSAVNYFNRVGTYQNMFHQYQNNLNAISSLHMSYNNKNSTNISNTQKPCSVNPINTYFNTVKERPDISITPVVSNISKTKLKSSKIASSNHPQNDHSMISLHLPKSVQLTPAQQLPLIKPVSQIQRASQKLEDKQIPLISKKNTLGNSLNLHHLTLRQTNPSPMAISTSSRIAAQSAPSLQHKLLSKQDHQRSYQTINTTTNTNTIKNPRHNRTTIHTSYPKLLNTEDTPFLSPDLTAITVNAIPSTTSQYSKLNQDFSKSIESRSSTAQIPLNSLRDPNNSNTLSVLTQLQQHTHLEIIPQTSNVKHGIDGVSCSDRFTGPQNTSESTNLLTSDSVTVFEISRRQESTTDSPNLQRKSRDKSEKNHVEIITLDD